MATFAFELVSPERLLISEQADAVKVPGLEGDFTVLPKHAPFITILRPGFVTVTVAGKEQRLYVRGGFAEVNLEGLTILADFALPAAEFDAAFAREVEIAEAAVANASSDEVRVKATQQLAWIKDLKANQASTAH